MRNLARNKSPLSFCNYKGEEAYVDEHGFKTGEKIIAYYPLVKIKAHVSGAKGSSYIEIFGTDVSYDKTILLTKAEFVRYGITENTVFFIDIYPKYEDQAKKKPLYDYRVKRIAETINEVVIAVEKVR